MPQPPAAPRNPFASFGRVDWLALAALAAIFVVVDSVFLAIGRHDNNVGLFVAWICIQAAICFAAGTIQGVRRRSWWEIVIVGVLAAVLLALIVLVVADSDPGSADCSGSARCDTSFGFGAVVIAIITTPLYTGLAAIGRAVGGLTASRLGRTNRGEPTV